MSFSGSISQCGGTGHAEEAFLAWWSSSGGEEGLGPACAAWSESERESDKEKWAGVKQRLSDCGCQLMKSGFWLVGVWGRETSLHLNASLEKHRTWRVLLLHHPPLFPKPPIPSPIWKGCCFEFWWKKTRNPLLPEFPLYTTSSPLLSPFIVTCL